MLKFKKIELPTKTDKNPSVNQNMDAVTRRLQEIWLVVLRKGKFFFGGVGGSGCLQLGRVGMGKKKEKEERRGSAEWGCIYFCRRIHRRNYSVCDSVGYSDGKKGTSPYGAAVLNPSVISSAFSSVKSVTSPYGADVLNPSVIPSVKNTRNYIHVSEPPFFLFSTFRS